MALDYLSRLAEAIRSADGAEEAAMLRADLAGALARFGELDRAKAEIAAIRRSNPRYEPSLTACVLLAEGQVHHFHELATDAVRSFRAAEAVARSAGNAEIAAAALAWVAASEFLNGEIAIAAEHAAHSLRNANARAFGTIARAELVVADCLSAAGLSDLATKHYQSARNAAIQLGDISMQSAVLFNRAAFAVAQASISIIEGRSDTGQIREAELQVQSVESLDQVVGLDSLNVLVPLMRAELALARSNWTDALLLFGKNLDSAEAQGQSRWMSKFLSEYSVAYAMSGAIDLATTTAHAAIDRIKGCTDTDDLAIAHSRLAMTFDLAHDSTRALEHRRAGQQYLQSFRSQQAQLQSDLSRVLCMDI